MSKSEDRLRKRRIAEAVELVRTGRTIEEAARSAGCSIRAVEMRLGVHGKPRPAKWPHPSQRP